MKTIGQRAAPFIREWLRKYADGRELYLEGNSPEELHEFAYMDIAITAIIDEMDAERRAERPPYEHVIWVLERLAEYAERMMSKRYWIGTVMGYADKKIYPPCAITCNNKLMRLFDILVDAASDQRQAEFDAEKRSETGTTTKKLADKE